MQPISGCEACDFRSFVEDKTVKLWMDGKVLSLSQDGTVTSSIEAKATRVFSTLGFRQAVPGGHLIANAAESGAVVFRYVRDDGESAEVSMEGPASDVRWIDNSFTKWDDDSYVLAGQLRGTLLLMVFRFQRTGGGPVAEDVYPPAACASAATIAYETVFTSKESVRYSLPGRWLACGGMASVGPDAVVGLAFGPDPPTISSPPDDLWFKFLGIDEMSMPRESEGGDHEGLAFVSDGYFSAQEKGEFDLVLQLGTSLEYVGRIAMSADRSETRFLKFTHAGGTVYFVKTSGR